MAEQYLKPAITFQQLDAQAGAISNNEAAQRLNGARSILFKANLTDRKQLPEIPENSPLQTQTSIGMYGLSNGK